MCPCFTSDGEYRGVFVDDAEAQEGGLLGLRGHYIGGGGGADGGDPSWHRHLAVRGASLAPKRLGQGNRSSKNCSSRQREYHSKVQYFHGIYFTCFAAKGTMFRATYFFFSKKATISHTFPQILSLFVSI